MFGNVGRPAGGRASDMFKILNKTQMKIRLDLPLHGLEHDNNVKEFAPPQTTHCRHHTSQDKDTNVLVVKIELANAEHR
jgi:hypothetical protein